VFHPRRFSEPGTKVVEEKSSFIYRHRNGGYTAFYPVNIGFRASVDLWGAGERGQANLEKLEL
jgi:hypothetical protein